MVPKPAGISINALPAPQPSLLSKVGAPLMYVFVFLVISRVADFWGSQLRLPLITGSLAVLLAIINGGVLRTIASRTGQLLILFTIWMIAITPLSYWRGGSVAMLTDQWSKALMAFIMIVGLVQNLQQCRKVMITMAVAVVAASLTVLYFGETMSGRLVAPVGMLNHPNALAQILLLGLPFWVMLMGVQSRIPFRKAIVILAIVPVLFAFFRTGSRGGAVGLAMMCLVVFFNVSFASRLKLLIAVLLVAGSVAAFIPDTIAARFALTTDPVVSEEGYVDGIQASAAESSQQRYSLFLESLWITIQNPIFGVGPGQFQAYQAAKAGEENEYAMWRETHCTYTQISSENGVLGLIFYGGALLYCLFRTRRYYRMTRNHPETADIAPLAFALYLSLVGFATTASFSSVAYYVYFPSLAGVCTGFFHVVDEEMRARGLTPGFSAALRRTGGLPVAKTKAVAEV